jgi:exopolyphosphatase/guanosine-5'-triphosphate,3'-diphosphate pyrophosphatase
MGCVSFSRRFFADGKITSKRLEHARAAAFQELEPVTQHYLRMGWQEVVGTSGTIRSVDDLSRALGLNQDWLSRQSFALIDEYLLKRRFAHKLDHVSEQRMPVFAGGYAIISAIFKALDLERLDCATGALREGVLYDLNGRLQNHDSRDQGVDAMVNRFGLDMEQANRIESTCYALLDQVKELLGLDQVIHRKLLGWASRLHEVGISISFSQNHKHGSYIVENSDIDGFSRQQQRLLALLIRSHRQKFPAALFLELPEPTRAQARHLAVLLRLSVALNRSRSETLEDQVNLTVKKGKFRLQISREWCDQHPLTLMDLELENKYLQQAGISFQIKQI